MSRKHSLAVGCLLLAALAAAYAFVSGFSAREDRKREQAEAAGVIPLPSPILQRIPPSPLRKTEMACGGIRRMRIFRPSRPLSRLLPMIWAI